MRKHRLEREHENFQSESKNAKLNHLFLAANKNDCVQSAKK